jgi:hypothetical protein
VGHRWLDKASPCRRSAPCAHRSTKARHVPATAFIVGWGGRRLWIMLRFEERRRFGRLEGVGSALCDDVPFARSPVFLLISQVGTP